MSKVRRWDELPPEDRRIQKLLLGELELMADALGKAEGVNQHEFFEVMVAVLSEIEGMFNRHVDAFVPKERATFAKCMIMLVGMCRAAGGSPLYGTAFIADQVKAQMRKILLEESRVMEVKQKGDDD